MGAIDGGGYQANQRYRVHVEQMNLNLLVPLATLLRTRNVTRAGQELHLSQSAMSAILARLRTAFGDPLLVKAGREMALTPYAESLVEPVDAILVQIDRMLTQRPGFDPSADGRTFTFVASDYSALFLLRPLLEQLQVEAPGVSFDIRPLHDRFADAVRSDEVDLLVVSEQLCTASLVDFPRKVMYRDEFVLAAWAGSGLFSTPPALSDMALMRFVQYVTGQRLNLADQALDELNVFRQVEMRTASQVVVPFMLTGTPLVALIPRRLAELTKDAAQLVIADPPVRLPGISDACTWHPRRSEDPAHQWLVRRLSALARNL